MRTLGLLFLLGCGKPAPAAPTSPAASPLQHDLAIFCGPQMQAHEGGPNVWGPWLEPQVTSGTMKQQLEDLKNGKVAITELFALVRQDMHDAGVASCPELDAMEHPTSP